MPYVIQKIGKKYRVINPENRRVHANGTSLKNAKAQVRLLNGIKHGLILRKNK